MLFKKGESSMTEIGYLFVIDQEVNVAMKKGMVLLYLYWVSKSRNIVLNFSYTYYWDI